MLRSWRYIPTCFLTILSLFTLTSLITCTFLAQPSHAQWVALYRGVGGGGPTSSVQQTIDGGYIMTVGPGAGGCGSSTGSVLKLNASGHIQWQKTYKDAAVGADCSALYLIQQTSDGGYIVAGHISSFGAEKKDFWVLKLDPNGNIVWQKRYGRASAEEASSIQQTSDGGYIVAGGINFFVGPQFSSDFWVLKLDANGNIQWQKAYSPGGLAIASSIQQTSDGGYIVTGSFGRVLKLDPNGNIVWQKVYTGVVSGAMSIQQTSDGGYIVAVDERVLKLDPNGNIVWQKRYEEGDWKLGAQSIRQTIDGEYIVAGQTVDLGTGSLELNIVVLKLDANGNIQWQKACGGDRWDTANSIQQTSDGGYIVAGYTFSFGGGFILLKLRQDGSIDSSCDFIQDNNVSGVDTNAVPFDTNIIPEDTGVIPQPTEGEAQDINVSVNFLCEAPPVVEETLLEKYAPILYMHPDERFHPTNVRKMLKNFELWRKRPVRQDIKADLEKLSLKTLMREKYNKKNYYLKLKDDAVAMLEDENYWKTAQTVYGREITVGKKKVLQYWFFYVFNDWENQHEGDWEMIQIVLGENKKPRFITYSIHRGGLKLSRVKENPNIRKRKGHPLVYVTLGGHGSWNEPGEHRWYQDYVVCFDCIDETIKRGEKADVLYPNIETFASRKLKYELKDLSDSPENHWIYWQGYWGAQIRGVQGLLGGSGPSSPPYIDYKRPYNGKDARWKEPLSWGKNPNPSKLPAYVICASDNSEIIVRDMEENMQRLFEHCKLAGHCGYCPVLAIASFGKDLTFDVYSLDGKEVDLQISKYMRGGEVYEVEFKGLDITKKGKASLFFSPKQNPGFEIKIDPDPEGFYESYRLPDYLKIKQVGK